MKAITNWLIYLAYLTLFVTWLLIGQVTYWSFFDKGLPSISNLETVSRTEVIPGESVTVRYSVNRYRACHANYVRVLDGQSPQSPTYNVDRGEREIMEKDTGKQVDAISTIVIPLDTLPGYYELYTRINYQCNPMQKIFPIVIDTPKAIIHVLSRAEIIQKELLNSK